MLVKEDTGVLVKGKNVSSELKVYLIFVFMQYHVIWIMLLLGLLPDVGRIMEG